MANTIIRNNPFQDEVIDKTINSLVLFDNTINFNKAITFYLDIGDMTGIVFLGSFQKFDAITAGPIVLTGTKIDAVPTVPATGAGVSGNYQVNIEGYATFALVNVTGGTIDGYITGVATT